MEGGKRGGSGGVEGVDVVVDWSRAGGNVGEGAKGGKVRRKGTGR